jgi:hypothetical protein
LNQLSIMRLPLTNLQPQFDCTILSVRLPLFVPSPAGMENR